MHLPTLRACLPHAHNVRQLTKWAAHTSTLPTTMDPASPAVERIDADTLARAGDALLALVAAARDRYNVAAVLTDAVDALSVSVSVSTSAAPLASPRPMWQLREDERDARRVNDMVKHWSRQLKDLDDHKPLATAGGTLLAAARHHVFYFNGNPPEIRRLCFGLRLFAETIKRLTNEASPLGEAAQRLWIATRWAAHSTNHPAIGSVDTVTVDLRYLEDNVVSALARVVCELQRWCVRS